MEIIKLLVDNPTSGTIVVVAALLLVFYGTKTYFTIARMEQFFPRVVTKKDLEIALLHLKDELAEIYVSKTDCDIIERRNGYMNGGRGGSFGP